MVSDRPPTPLLQKSDSTCDARTGNCEPAATPPAASSHSSRRLHTPTLASTTRTTLSHSGSGRGSESHRLGAVAVGGPPVLANLAAPLVATGSSGGSFFCPTGGADPLWDDLFFTTPSFGTMSDVASSQSRPAPAKRLAPSPSSRVSSHASARASLRAPPAPGRFPHLPLLVFPPLLSFTIPTSSACRLSQLSLSTTHNVGLLPCRARSDWWYPPEGPGPRRVRFRPSSHSDLIPD